MRTLLLLLNLLGCVSGGRVLAAPATQTASAPAKALPLAQRKAIWTATMRGQLRIAGQTQDAGLTSMLETEGKNTARRGEQASLSCAAMKRLDAQAAKQEPLIRALHNQIRARYGITQAVLDAVLQEGERQGWPLPTS